MQDTFSTTKAAAMTGGTMRQLDYLARTGTVHPAVDANGKGTKRAWSLPQVRALRVLVVLSGLGAQAPVLAETYATLGAMTDWPPTVIVSAEGLMTVPDSAWHPSGYVLNLAEAAAFVEHRMAAFATQ